MGDPDRDVLALDAALRMVAGKRCVICDKRPGVFQGLFFPYDSVRFGGIPGKQRVWAYPLCKRCKKRPDHMERVEARLLKSLASRWN